MRKLALSVAAAVVLSLAMPATGAPPVVLVKDDFFQPTRVVIKKGGRVTWRWRGEELHNVALKPPDSSRVAKRSALKREGSYSPRLRRVGKWRALCELHPDEMRMRVIVRRPS